MMIVYYFCTLHESNTYLPEYLKRWLGGVASGVDRAVAREDQFSLCLVLVRLALSRVLFHYVICVLLLTHKYLRHQLYSFNYLALMRHTNTKNYKYKNSES